MPLSPRRVQAVFWTKTAAVAFLAAASSQARGVNAIRSTVDRDFLRAHFQAHLLQRDWLPQSSNYSSSSSSLSSSFSSSSTPANHAAITSKLQDAPPSNKVLFVTAIYGDYEKTLKEPEKQQHPADFVAFTDRTDLSSPTWQIRLVEDPLDYLLKHGSRVGVGAIGSVHATAASAHAGETAAEQAGKGHSTAAEEAGKVYGTAAAGTMVTANTDGVNSLTRNRHPFNLAKVFKMQFYRFFDLTDYRAAVWLDATVRIMSPQTAGIIYRLLADERRNFVTFEHTRGGLMSEEVTASKSWKYEGTHWGCCDQPYQNMTRQYEEYLLEGFTEKWWLKEYDAPMGLSNRPEWGVWVTCFVAFDLHSPISFEFLDAWWRENVVRTTQDQVTFPYIAWKMKVYPFSLPSPGVSGGSWGQNDLYEMTSHGLRRQLLSFAM
jgi:hypothetical protein